MPSSSHSVLRVLALGIAVLAALGCASTGGDVRGIDPRLSAAENLQRQAAHEARSGPGSPPATPGLVAAPPGVGAALLAPRPVTDVAARLPLHAALAELVPPPAPRTPRAATPPPDDADRDGALRHYAKGRDAALRNRHLVAITELEKALSLDPRSPAILRQLARSYVAMGNDTRAAALFEELIELDPDDSETLFVLGLAATNRRDFARAASFLGRPRLAGAAFDHDPAAACLADFMLGSALKQLGYDRAWVELARAAVSDLGRLPGSTIYRFRYESLYRQRSEIWRSVGDAHCRLGEYLQALESYRNSAMLPNADPDALYARVIYANLAMGHRWGAQAALLEALAGDSPASEQDIRLCGYVAEHVGTTELLAEALVGMHSERPDDPTLVRAAALLLPRDEALGLLRSFLRRRPEDLDVLGQLLAWLGARDLRSAVSLTVGLVEDHPALGADYGDRLALVASAPGALLDAAESLPPSAARAVVLCRLLVSIGANGRAWSVCEQALEWWPQTQGLRLQQVDLAVRLEEPQLVEQALEGLEPFDDLETRLTRARARRALGQTELAVRNAAAAVEMAASSDEALVELAAAEVAHAENLRDPDGRLEHANRAVVAAREALALNPRRDAAYAVLLALHAPNALLGDRDRIAELRAQLAQENSSGSLAARLDAQEDAARGRYERALERLLIVCEADPADTEALELAVAVWAQAERTEDAIAWIEGRLKQRPADTALLEQLAALLVREDRAQEAIARISKVIEAAPAHDAARFVLETLYRREGRQDLAIDLAETRLLTRPHGLRRELGLAAAYAGAEMDEQAAARLEWVLQRAEIARYDQLVSALTVAGRLSDRDSRFHRLSLDFAQRTVTRFPDAPIQVYGSGLRALARLDLMDERFDELADRAVRHARGASAPSVQSADLWRQLAQALVDSGHPPAASRAVRARLLAPDAPLDPQSRTLLAIVALVGDAATGDVDASISLIERLAMRGLLPAFGGEPEPELAEVYYNCATIYSTLGKDDGAIRLLEEAIRLAPDNAMALNNLGYTRLELGYADERTVACIKRAHQLAPDDSNVLDTIGWLRYKRGRFDDGADSPGALGLIQKSLDQAGEPSPEVLDHLGDTLWRLGDPEGAVEAWGKAVTLLQIDGLRDQMEQQFVMIQARSWGLMVADPGDLYDRQYGDLLKRAEEKLREVDAGGDPAVAPTFEEMGLKESIGDMGNGRP